MGDAGLGVRLLSTEAADEAAAIAATLEACNRERRDIEAAVLEQAEALAEQATSGIDAARAPLLMVAGEGWHPGVIGIVASRLKDRYNRPACVIALDGPLGKGSGRSIRGAALGPAVIAARQAGLVIDGGGHAMAAGFTVAAERIDALGAFLNEHIARQLGYRAPVVGLGIDAALSPGGATMQIVEALEAVGPFGAGNPRPRFALPSVRIARAGHRRQQPRALLPARRRRWWWGGAAQGDRLPGGRNGAGRGPAGRTRAAACGRPFARRHLEGTRCGRTGN